MAPQNDREREIVLELLLTVRKEQRFTQVQLAKSIGAKQPVVSKYEAGDLGLDFLVLVEICDALRISIVKFAERFESARKSTQEIGRNEGICVH